MQTGHISSHVVGDDYAARLAGGLSALSREMFPDEQDNSEVLQEGQGSGGNSQNLTPGASGIKKRKRVMTSKLFYVTHTFFFFYNDNSTFF